MEKTIRETLRNEKYPYAHFAKVIAEKSRGTINQDEAAQMAIRLMDKKSSFATQTIASEVLKRLKSTKS